MKELKDEIDIHENAVHEKVNERVAFAEKQSKAWHQSSEGIAYKAKTANLESAKDHLLNASYDLDDYNN